MKRIFKHATIDLLVILLCSACALTNLLSGGGDDDDSQGSSAPSAGEVDLNQVSNSTAPGLVRADKKKYSPEDFAARTIPVDVTLAGPITPEVRFDGALAEPNYDVQNAATMHLRLYLVFYLPGDSVLTQGPDSIYFSSYKMTWKVDLFDAAGTLLQSSDINVNSALQPAYLHAFDAYIDEIPASTASAKVTVTFAEELRMGASCITPDPTQFCATAADVGKRAPDAILQVSPAQVRIEKDSWTESYAVDSPLGKVSFQYRNPYAIGLSPIITLLFTDERGELAGYLRIDDYIEPGQLRGRAADDSYQASYFASVPTGVQVYTWVTVSDLITALR